MTMFVSRGGRRRGAAVFAAALAALAAAPAAAQEEPIKVGVLHSLSGTMAISETTLKDTILMLVEDLNASGGLLGPPTGRCSPKRRAN